MKQLSIPRIEAFSRQPKADELCKYIDSSGAVCSIDTNSWPQFSDRPRVSFRIGWNDWGVLLKYSVTEETSQALRRETNSTVHLDSCVEWFVEPHTSQGYYNFEFNCIGTTHTSFGTGRNNRTDLEPRILEQVLRYASLGDQPFQEQALGREWHLTIGIPFTLLNAGVPPRTGESWRGNFYKCGEELTDTHFLSWNRIKTEAPDFHRPEYFATLIFE